MINCTDDFEVKVIHANFDENIELYSKQNLQCTFFFNETRFDCEASREEGSLFYWNDNFTVTKNTRDELRIELWITEAGTPDIFVGKGGIYVPFSSKGITMPGKSAHCVNIADAYDNTIGRIRLETEYHPRRSASNSKESSPVQGVLNYIDQNKEVEKLKRLIDEIYEKEETFFHFS